MVDFYLAHAVGVKDSTLLPPAKFDGRLVGAKSKATRAIHPAGVAYALADRLFLASLKAGEQITNIEVTSDTTLGTTTLSVGTTAIPAKSANARTMTVVDTPTEIGPRATAVDDGPLAADEDVWVTLAVTGIAGAVIFAIDFDVISSS